MFPGIHKSGSNWANSLVLRAYGWQRRSHSNFGRPAVQWKNPQTGLWYREATALRILKVDLIDPYNR